MHSRFVSISAIAVIIYMPIFWKNNANAADWFDGQEILIECPVWGWEPSPMPNIEYELCFDDTDHCAVAEIGDSVCIPYLGVHDIWVTAIDNQGAEPVYYDGDIVPVMRTNSSDFDGDDVVGYSDFGMFAVSFGNGNGSGGSADLDEDGTVGFSDFAQFARAFGKCVNESGTIYEACP
jgi:hypothetical protein